MVHEELSLGYGYWRGDGAQGLRAGSSRNKKKTEEPPTKKFRQNKVCSYFPFAIPEPTKPKLKFFYMIYSFVSEYFFEQVFDDLTKRFSMQQRFVLKVSQSQSYNHFTSVWHSLVI